MAQRTQTLRVGSWSTRATTNKRYHVAVESATRANKLVVTKRTNDLKYVDREVDRLWRDTYNARIYVFELGVLRGIHRRSL